MLTYLTGQYKIEVSNAGASVGNTDFHSQFDSLYLNPEIYLSSGVAIRLYCDDDLVKAILIGAGGGATGVSETSVIFDKNRIACCCSDTIFCISVPELGLLWRTKADLATCFQIFKYNEDYIVHGELEISRIDQFGEIIWQRCGADIFVAINRKEDNFIITDNSIQATDWDNRRYKFDFDGNLIE